jgi:5-formyltetrahydrofolate cyclo-ligase
MTKNEIRDNQKELRNKLSGEEQKVLSTAIWERLYETQAYQSCRRLLTFVSFQSEVDTREIIRHSIRSGKTVYIPRVEAHGLEFYRIAGLEGLLPGSFGVLEPQPAEADRYVPDGKDRIRGDIDNLMLLPGLAFDTRGNRIGYGAGYYDRYLSVHPPAEFYKVAVAYDFQIFENIPSEPFDIKSDLIITPTRLIDLLSCREKAAWEKF